MKFLPILLLAASAVADYKTYPKVAKTASINGFADPIKDLLPECASDCVDFSTSNTPCPYWDTGCLCVMPQWSGQVGQCIALSCKGSDAALATALAYSLCVRVGADMWMMPASISSALISAADGVLISLSATRGDLVTTGDDSSGTGSATVSASEATASGDSSSKSSAAASGSSSGSASASNSGSSRSSGSASATASGSSSAASSASSTSTSANGAYKASTGVAGALLTGLFLILS